MKKVSLVIEPLSDRKNKSFIVLFQKVAVLREPLRRFSQQGNRYPSKSIFKDEFAMVMAKRKPFGMKKVSLVIEPIKRDKNKPH